MIEQDIEYILDTGKEQATLILVDNISVSLARVCLLVNGLTIGILCHVRKMACPCFLSARNFQI